MTIRRRTRSRDACQPGLFEPPLARQPAREPYLEATLRENSLLAQLLRREICDLLDQRRTAGATEAELLHALRVAPRLVSARLQELLTDGEIVPVGDAYVLMGWAEREAEEPPAPVDEMPSAEPTHATQEPAPQGDKTEGNS